MKVGIRRGVALILVVGIATAWIGCGRSDTGGPGRGSGTKSKRAAERSRQREALLQWNQKTLAEAYQSLGKRSAAWDGEASKALDAFAQMRSQGSRKTDPQLRETLVESVRAAVVAGCDDPLILYLNARFLRDSDADKAAYATQMSDLADRFNAGSYPAVRRFYATLRAAEAAEVTIGPDRKLPPRLVALRYSSTVNLLAALREPGIPAAEVYECVDAWLATARRSARQFPEDMRFVGPALEALPQDPPVLVARADCAVALAWNARGSGYADKVTDQGWKDFRASLLEAQKLLKTAWKADPSDPRAAVQMLEVAVGLSFKRAEMETWFQRAMASDPDNYAAATGKLRYLKPQWHGSDEEMIRFGKECVASKAWGGRVPLVLYDAHLAIASFLPAAERTGYWRDPRVWQDVSNSFEKLFTTDTTSNGYRHDYAKRAFQAGQWEKFLEQLPLFERGTNYEFFGGPQRFDQMVAEARRQSTPAR